MFVILQKNIDKICIYLKMKALMKQNEKCHKFPEKLGICQSLYRSLG